jgi:hypothetical protein
LKKVVCPVFGFSSLAGGSTGYFAFHASAVDPVTLQVRWPGVEDQSHLPELKASRRDPVDRPSEL